ncbi:unnamed protein product [Tenebrio molitor]|nr:unnamed protein product [Tenebrio molitor]
MLILRKERTPIRLESITNFQIGPYLYNNDEVDKSIMTKALYKQYPFATDCVFLNRNFK